jgi:serralysin
MATEKATHICTTIVPPEVTEDERERLGIGGTKAAAAKAFIWEPGSTITVRFLEGDPDLQRRVREVAEEWTYDSEANEPLANLTFNFLSEGDANIRIAFMQGGGSWSYMGTQCRQIPQDQPTMNYGWLTPDSSDEEVRSVVLHEFGHAIGLIHEHQNPNEPIKWNRPAVRADLSGPPNNWDEATIRHNIFDRYKPKDIVGTPVDKDSIMMYPIPASWTNGTFTADFNGDLSPIDKQLIREVYRST